MEKFRVTIASPPDRELLVAEVIYDGVQWAEVSQDTGELIVQFYSHPRLRCWEFPFDDAFAALMKAKKRLLGELP